MAQKQVSDLYLSINLDDAVEDYLLDLAAARRSLGFIEAVQGILTQLQQYARDNQWPGVDQITPRHLRKYLVYVQSRPRWFGERADGGKPISSSYYETIYRRIKRFFTWLVQNDMLAVSRIASPKM